MPDMQTALLARLAADAGVAAIVADKIYWNKVPQPAPPAAPLSPPYVRLQTISDLRPQDLEDYEIARETRVQVDCFGKSYKSARQTAEAIIAATREPATFGGVVFGRIKAEGPRDLGEDTTSGFIHRASLDLLVWHRLA